MFGSLFECFGELKMTVKETNVMDIVLFPHLFLHMISPLLWYLNLIIDSTKRGLPQTE